MVYVMIRTCAVAIILCLFFKADSWAACTGQFAPGQACGNATSGAKDPTGVGLSPLFDRAFGAPSAQGSVLNRGAGSWSSTITPVLGNPGTTTGMLGLGSATGGTATIVPPAIVGNITVQLPSTPGTIPTTALSPILLDSVTGVMSCPTCVTGTGGALAINNTSVSGALAGQVLFSDGSLLQAYPITGTGDVVLSTSPTLITPILGIASATTINKVTLTEPATGSTLTIVDGKTLTTNNSITLSGTDGTTWTGPTVNASLAALNIAGQTITGGANVTTLTQSTGNLTVNCGDRPTQSITNGGAFTITAPANDGYCVLLVTNNATAGAITFSGFSVGSNTGDALTTTDTHKFMIFIYRVASNSTFSIKALQ